MALLPWNSEDDNKDSLFQPQPIKKIASVQSGSWQPAPSGADSASATDDVTQGQPQQGGIFGQTPTQQPAQQSSTPYLVSQEKAQVDQAKRQRDAQIAEARRQAAAQQAARAIQTTEQKPQQPTATPKYMPAKGPKQEGGVKGFLKGVGAGIQQGLAAAGDVAIQAGGIVHTVGRDGAELQKNLAEVEKVRSWLHNKKDITGNKFVGTQDVEQQALNIVNGDANIRDVASVAGKGLQVGLDSTMFMNPARLATLGALKSSVNPIVKYAARDAAFFGSLQGTATFQRVYGETGDMEAAIVAAAKDAAIGGALQGGLDVAGQGIGVAANRTANSLRKPKAFDELGNEIADVVEEAGVPTVPQEVTPAPAPTDGNVTFEPNAPQFSPVADGIPLMSKPGEVIAPSADGVPALADNVTPVTPANDVNLNEVAPVQNTPAPEVTPVQPVADGVAQQADVVPAIDPNMPTVKSGELQLQESRAGKSQAEEAAINQKIQEAQAATPAIDNVPDVPVTPDGTLTPAQVAERLMPKLADNSDVKARIAEAVDMGKDTASPLEDILRDGNVNPKRAEKITKHFNDLEEQVRRYNSLEEQNQKAYAEGGANALDENVSRERSRVAREMGTTTRRLMTEIKRMEGSRDHKVALINGLTDIIGTRNANVLTSAGLLERNIFQELTANAKLALKNPIKMARSTFGNGNIIKDTAKGELSHWKDAPRNPVEAAKYVIGNTYRTAMTPTTILANTRRGAIRDELTKWAFQELEGRKVSSAEAHGLAGTAGNEMEALVNTFIGVDNGMTNRKQATEALKAWKEYIRTGDDGARAEFLAKVEQHNSLADQMIAGLSKEDQGRARGLMAMKNLIFPFVRTATNLTKNAVRQDLNPFAKSLLDEIRADQRGSTANAINTIKSKLVDYGIMGGAAALATSGALVYNDGDEVDKPKGWSLKIDDDRYVPIRATSVELPLAIAGTGARMMKDIENGDARDWKYYAGMVTGSLPYIDQFNQTTGAVDSLAGMGDESGDKGYAAKSYAVNTIKSFVPGSNNGVQAYVAGKQGESLNAKTVYDKNFGTWLQNSIQKSYDPEFYNGLKDSRDNAGRVRTVDNQGIISNKTINDAPTAEFNQRITDLVDYGRKAGLGKNTQDMFNTYDTGKNNNFKSIQDTITFLDSNGNPDPAKKLENNEKLADLATQIRDGFYGESGMELLTLDGKELKSDASAPLSKSGNKNTKLPISMQSIKNAIAATDLPKDQNEMLNVTLAAQSSELWDRFKNQKSISYEQYASEKAKIEQQQAEILSNSKNYQKMTALMNKLDEQGFFKAGGLGSTKAGQTYLWNSLNALLGSKGATPAATYPEDTKAWTPWGNRGTGRTSKSGGNLEGGKGVQFTPVTARQLAAVKAAQFTPFKVKVKLGNEIKRDRSQNYSDRSF